MIHSTEFDIVFLTPMALALAFMVWVLWNVAKQFRK
jgi:hypothetical protein